MAKYIDVEKLMANVELELNDFRDFMGIYYTGISLEDLTKVVEKTPAVNVVKCAECKYFFNGGFCGYIDGLVITKPDSFCCFGEKNVKD